MSNEMAVHEGELITEADIEALVEEAQEAIDAAENSMDVLGAVLSRLRRKLPATQDFGEFCRNRLKTKFSKQHLHNIRRRSELLDDLERLARSSQLDLADKFDRSNLKLGTLDKGRLLWQDSDTDQWLMPLPFMEDLAAACCGDSPVTAGAVREMKDTHNYHPEPGRGVPQRRKEDRDDVEGFTDDDSELLNNIISHVKADFMAVERRIYPGATSPDRMKPDEAIAFLKSIMPKCKASRGCMTEKTGDGFYELELVNEQYDAKEKGMVSRSKHKYAVPFRVTVSIEVDCE